MKYLKMEETATWHKCLRSIEVTHKQIFKMETREVSVSRRHLLIIGGRQRG
jgi:hypothetical protein